MGTYGKVLFADPTILSGAGSILDLGNSMFEFNASPTPELADELANRCDWMQVNTDLNLAVDKFEMENPHVKKLSKEKTRQ